MTQLISTNISSTTLPRVEPSILAVVVLYKMDLLESVAVRTLLHVFDNCSDIARHFSLILYDNSPELHNSELAINVPVHYKHDPTNAGLAAAYNYALAYAGETSHAWLLLLDQDTTLTYDFVAELIARVTELGAHQNVASIVPRLVVEGHIHSPSSHFIDQVRHQYKRPNHAVTKDLVGIQQGRLGAYNSGATLKVSALQLIGGFPADYWLDYLDHAVFHALSVHGFSMYIMNAMLKHDPSQASPGIVPIWRERNILIAQTRFVRQAGNFLDRLLYRLWLLRRSKDLLICYPGKRLWMVAALQAFLLRKGSGRRETRSPPSL